MRKHYLRIVGFLKMVKENYFSNREYASLKTSSMQGAR